MARSTFPSQNVQNTPCSDHFWRFRCRKSARRCGAKHISKSKVLKTDGLGPLFEVQMSRTTTLHYTKLHYTTLHYTRLHYITLHYTTLHYTTFHYTSRHYSTLHSTTLHLQLQLHSTTLHYITLHYSTLNDTAPKIDR